MKNILISIWYKGFVENDKDFQVLLSAIEVLFIVSHIISLLKGKDGKL